MFPKLFTLQEANRELPHVKKIVAEILGRGKRLQDLLSDDPPDEATPEIEKIGDEIDDLMRTLEARGCFYKDWNFQIGLIDFPAIIDGREAMLCWRIDEAEILWYHGIEDGFAGRRPLPAQWLLGDLFKEQK